MKFEKSDRHVSLVLQLFSCTSARQMSPAQLFSISSKWNQPVETLPLYSQYYIEVHDEMISKMPYVFSEINTSPPKKMNSFAFNMLLEKGWCKYKSCKMK